MLVKISQGKDSKALGSEDGEGLPSADDELTAGSKLKGPRRAM